LEKQETFCVDQVKFYEEREKLYRHLIERCGRREESLKQQIMDRKEYRKRKNKIRDDRTQYTKYLGYCGERKEFYKNSREKCRSKKEKYMEEIRKNTPDGAEISGNFVKHVEKKSNWVEAITSKQPKAQDLGRI
jgi:hypothetical protein